MEQISSVIGAILILAAFFLSQTGRVSREDKLYNILNLIGSAILGVIAVINWQAGFVLLEGSWAILSIYALIKYWSAE